MANLTIEERARRAAAANKASESRRDDPPPAEVAADAEAVQRAFEDGADSVMEDERYLRQFLEVDQLPRRTRKSTLDTTGLPTDIPDHLKMPGWAYCWFPTHVYGEPVEMWQQTAIENGAWEPVPARLILTLQKRGSVNLLPEGWRESTVDQGAQRLYMRPEYIDAQSRAEDIARARRQSEGRLNLARVDGPLTNYANLQRTQEPVYVEPGVRGTDALAAEVEMRRGEARAARAAQDPLGGSLRTSADDIPAAERAEIAARHRRADGRVSLG
jgi:hypothetical protein